MRTKENNHQERVRLAAIDGINEHIAWLTWIHDSPAIAKAVYGNRDPIVEKVLDHVRRHFTIRPRNRK